MLLADITGNHSRYSIRGVAVRGVGKHWKGWRVKDKSKTAGVEAVVLKIFSFGLHYITAKLH